jgi:protein-S-isoprenylcysteine O-methyltransferase Ste14
VAKHASGTGSLDSFRRDGNRAAATRKETTLAALSSLFYGVVVYVFFLATFLYAIGFTGNLIVPKTIDSGPSGPLAEALVVDVLLLGVFAVQHSVMARRSFKRWWTRTVPPAVERSTYVLAATLALALLLWQWRPIAEPVIWSVDSVVAANILWVIFWLGWTVLLTATFLINHFELFGLRQVFARIGGRELPAQEFRTPFLYRYVRHPIYLGFLLGFWSTPVMTAGHLLFSIATSGYILVGIWFEERDLVAQFGEQYRRYRRQVGMLVPIRKG